MSKHHNVTRNTSRAVVVLLFAASLLIALTATVWAAWGASWRGSPFLAVSLRPTATPTRTPRPVTPPPQRTVLQPHIVVVTPVPAPTATPLPTAVPTDSATAEPLPPYLAEIVADYGMDPARRFVVVDPNTQRMTIWDPGHPVRELLISTGDEARGYRTPAWYGLVGRYWGTFQAFGVYADDGWYLYDDPTGSILIHSAPYRLVNGQKVYEGLEALGNYPASHGCIRLSPEDARWFTAWQPRGVPLVVLPRKGG